MKKRIVVFIAALMALMFTLGFSAHTVSAEESSPSVSIEKFNLAFENDTHLKYAVKFIGIDDSEINYNNIGMLYWTDYDGGFTPGTENYSSKTTGYTMIDEEKYYAFEYDNLAAKQLTDYVYSIAYLEYNGETYYSEPVKYSALEYAYNRLGKTDEGTTDTELITILNNMLTYGASAQEYFDYKEDRLATDDFYQITVVGGTLEDGFAKGLFANNETATLISREKDGVLPFAYWAKADGEFASEVRDFEVKNISKNSKYYAIYEEKYTDGLTFTLSDDGTYYSLSGLGSCKESKIVIPWVYKGIPVTRIEKHAFYNCDSVKSVIIPSTITDMDDLAISYCVGLAEHQVNEYNGYYRSVSGVIYSKDGTELIRYPQGSLATSFVLPDEVTKISAYAFYNAQNLITFETTEASNLLCVGDHAFYQCYKMKRFDLPDTIEEFGESAFYSCVSLEEMPNLGNITVIPKYLFGNCHNALKEVRIPYGITKICEGAFSACDNLETIVLPSTVKTLESRSLHTWGHATIVFEGSREEWNKVNTNYGGCFYDKYTLRVSGECSENLEYELSNDGTFYILKGIGSCKDYDILVPETYNGLPIKEIAAEAFERSYIVKLTISDSITKIGAEAFSSCYDLKKVIIGDGVIDISNIFGYISYVDYITIGSNVSIIGSETLHALDGVIEFRVSDSNKSFTECNGDLYSKDGTTFIRYANGKENGTPVIPNGITTIGAYSFYNAKIECVNIPNSVIEIQDSAFDRCSNLSSVQLSDSLEIICSRAFDGCDSLYSINIGSSIKKISSGAFGYNTSISEIYYSGNIAQWILVTSKCRSQLENVSVTCSETVESSENLSIDVFSSGYDSESSYAFVNGVGECTDSFIVIPDTYNYDYYYYEAKVVGIGSEAFQDVTAEAVFIPKSVTVINSYAFNNCSIDNIIFENPTGWYYIQIGGMNEKHYIDLSDPEEAAYELKNSHGTFYHDTAKFLWCNSCTDCCPHDCFDCSNYSCVGDCGYGCCIDPYNDCTACKDCCTPKCEDCNNDTCYGDCGYGCCTDANSKYNDCGSCSGCCTVDCNDCNNYNCYGDCGYGCCYY